MKRDFCLLILLSCFACAGARRGEHAAVAAKSWVDETLAGLSLEQKVGQMIYPRSDGGFVNASDPEARTLIEAARSGRIGGVVFFKGEPYETAAIVNRLQQASKLPLLMASDYEWGTAMRVGGGTRFPRAMAMGAGARLVDMEFQAEVTAREARAYGIHLLLNPVLDLSTNPKNRVITTRSFGQDPQRAGELGAAYIERAQALGVLTTAKHFPGHGATVVDSHLGLPVLDLDLERLKRVEMAPFRAAIDAGVAAVMPGHIAVPALGGSRELPSTVSKEVLQGVLRTSAYGLIVRCPRHGRRAAESFLRAGVDMLLVPPETPWWPINPCFEAERGDIPLARIDRAVRRILEAASRTSSSSNALEAPLPSQNRDSRGRPSFRQAVTLVKNERNLLAFGARRFARGRSNDRDRARRAFKLDRKSSVIDEKTRMYDGNNVVSRRPFAKRSAAASPTAARGCALDGGQVAIGGFS